MMIYDADTNNTYIEIVPNSLINIHSEIYGMNQVNNLGCYDILNKLSTSICIVNSRNIIYKIYDYVVCNKILPNKFMNFNHDLIQKLAKLTAVKELANPSIK